MWFYRRVMCPKDADGMANSVDPDHLIWVCTVCPDLPVQKLRIITVTESQSLLVKGYAVLLVFFFTICVLHGIFSLNKCVDIHFSLLY